MSPQAPEGRATFIKDVSGILTDTAPKFDFDRIGTLGCDSGFLTKAETEALNLWGRFPDWLAGALSEPVAQQETASIDLYSRSTVSLEDAPVSNAPGSPLLTNFNLGSQVVPPLCETRIPAGFLHGFLTLSDDTEIVYKCTDHYAPECDGAVRWDSCGIDWPLPEGVTPLLSDKDSAAQTLDAFDSPFTYGASA